MTENNLLVAKLFLDDLSCKSKCNEIDTLKEVLEEIQQYRAIGTVDALKADKVIADKAYRFIMDDIEMLLAYRAIGTVEECRTAVERMRKKKVARENGFCIAKDTDDNRYYSARFCCPLCGAELRIYKHDFCTDCGQKLDWDYWSE